MLYTTTRIKSNRSSSNSSSSTTTIVTEIDPDAPARQGPMKGFAVEDEVKTKKMDICDDLIYEQRETSKNKIKTLQ